MSESDHIQTDTPQEPLTAEDIVEMIRLTCGHEKPVELLEIVSGHRELMTPAFEKAVDEALELSRKGMLQDNGDWLVPGFATVFLSEWKVPGTHQRLLDILSMPDGDREWLIADALIEDWPQLLTATFEGDLQSIAKVVLNKKLNEYARAMPIQAVGSLAHHGLIPRDTAEEWFGMVFDKLERKEGFYWTKLASTVADMRFVSFLPRIKKAFDQGFCDEFVSGSYEDLEQVMHERNPWEKCGMVYLYEFDEPNVVAKDMICAWPYFHAKPKDWPIPKSPLFLDDTLPPTPKADIGRVYVPSGQPKVGRNDPCPCGSGKKFKKCYGGT